MGGVDLHDKDHTSASELSIRSADGKVLGITDVDKRLGVQAQPTDDSLKEFYEMIWAIKLDNIGYFIRRDSNNASINVVIIKVTLFM
ncbi:hypothetical protein NPIL_384381 [Nephila pilipes]|uniref:Uncharacterized protein n=1 Tax=Nephila pilipes TaxID=299642 RepID=A0A8X6QX10_NEPPI|nr:hypothetical protein NPIL_384381 [Nephila pilipes]